MKIKILFAGLLTLALFAAAHAQTPDKAELDRFFDRLAEKNKAMGSLVVARDGKVLYSRAVGYSRISAAEKKPLTAATRFRVGSITKMFTAALVLQLVEERKLKLTDTLDKFFPQIPNAGKITIAQILAHRSGIHDITEDRDSRPSRTNPITKDEMVAVIAKSKPDFEPDAKYAYSNSGYFLLGMLVEKLTGKSYGEALRKRITSKLGLKDTYAGTGSIDVNKNESFSYRYVRDWEQQPETHSSILFGSGAIISTPNDLVRFIQAL
ncbi:MAG TPA: serine hydrolase domain-containing protein, partial [Pyrinomonadaceae bacterium]